MIINEKTFKIPIRISIIITSENNLLDSVLSNLVSRKTFHMFEGRPMTFFINYVRGCFVKCIRTWRVYRVVSCYWAENYLVHHQTTVGTGLNVHQRFGIEFRVTKFQNFIVWWIDLFEMVHQVK